MCFCNKEMKPTVAADEMFPEGVGPYMDLEEASHFRNSQFKITSFLLDMFIFYTLLLKKNNGKYTHKRC